MRYKGQFFVWVFLAVMLDVTIAERKNWLLLVAGSKEWHFYSTEANMCHAYQVAHAHGIPDEQIVVMLYDDIAYNVKNVYPGVIMNIHNGANVYEGVPKDYTGEEVNADVFYAVLRGDKERVKELIGREGKVIASGPEDHVFVAYSGYGEPGTLVMPAKPDIIYADELNEAIKSLYAEKKYGKFVFYLESGWSGSMFEGLLPEDINAYAMTATDPDEMAWLCYFEVHLMTCLGGEFSCGWLEHSDRVDINTVTLKEQHKVTRDRVQDSHVQQYGNLSITSLPVGQFLGSSGLTVGQFLGSGGKPALVNATKPPKEEGPTCPMSNDEKPIFILEKQLAGPLGRKHGKELSRSLAEHRWLRKETQAIMEDVARLGLPGQQSSWLFNDQVKIKDWNCYKRAVEGLIEQCPRLTPSRNDYIMKRLRVLANLCDSLPEETVMKAVKKATRKSRLCVM